MSAPAKCPGCGCKLQPDWENCPNCPLSFADETPHQNVLRSDGFRGLVMPGAFFLVLALGWTLGSYLWDQARADSQSVTMDNGGLRPEDAARELLTGPSSPLAKSATTQDASVATAAAPDGSVGRDEEDLSAIAIASDSSPSRDKPIAEWKLRGTVYDLLTLQPVPGCAMTFTDNLANVRAQSVTNARGLYRIILPPLKRRGYLVSISKPGYAKTYLNPGTEGVALMDLARREELARELSVTVAEPASLQPYAETPLVTDFHLAPKR